MWSLGGPVMYSVVIHQNAHHEILHFPGSRLLAETSPSRQTIKFWCPAATTRGSLQKTDFFILFIGSCTNLYVISSLLWSLQVAWILSGAPIAKKQNERYCNHSIRERRNPAGVLWTLVCDVAQCHMKVVIAGYLDLGFPPSAYMTHMWINFVRVSQGGSQERKLPIIN